MVLPGFVHMFTDDRYMCMSSYIDVGIHINMVYIFIIMDIID